MCQIPASSIVTDPPRSELPYPRSWIDSLIRWIHRIPGPSWPAYVVAIVGFALLNNVVFWLDGSLAPGSYDTVRVLDSGFIVFFAAL